MKASRWVFKGLQVALYALLAFGLERLTHFQKVQLRDPRGTTGWLLFALVLFLAIFFLRKKLTMFPLGAVQLWTKIHIFIGLLAGFVFLCHLDFSLPNGTLDRILAVFFGGTFLSGLAGWYLSKFVPGQLAEVNQQVLPDEISFQIEQLKREARSLLLESVEKTHSDTLVTFYRQKLEIFLEQPHFFWFKSRRPSRGLSQILNATDEIRRYLNADERVSLDTLIGIAKRKDDLDYLFSGDRLLKGWLFLHLPLTAVLILLAMVHLLWIFVFRGGFIG